MKYKIEWTEDFKEEIDNICEYLNFMSKTDILSEKLVLKTYESAKRLLIFPEMYPLFDKKDKYGYEYRKMVVAKRYIVLYYIDYDDRIVYIAHIYDGRSNYTRKLV